MNGKEFSEDFWTRMVGLFPRCEFTDEEVENWRARVAKVPLGEAMAALSDLHAHAKGRPRIADFWQYVREHSGAHESPTEAKRLLDTPTEAEFYRRRWNRDDLSDDEILLRVRCDVFEQSLDVYGPTHPSTIGAFKRWQSQVAHTGGTPIEYDPAHWTAEYERRHGTGEERLDVTSWLKRGDSDEAKGTGADAEEAGESGAADGVVSGQTDGPERTERDGVEAVYDGGSPPPDDLPF